MRTLILLFVLLVSCDKQELIQSDIFTDPRDGKQYGTVEIGNQIWMDRNMEYLPYHNENYIPSDDYGVFYSWYVSADICPDGWHVPSDEEWIELFEYFGGDVIDGLRYGEFKALYSGWYQNSYSSETRLGAWWSSTEYGIYAWVFYLKHRDGALKTNLPKTSNICIRCLKDKS